MWLWCLHPKQLQGDSESFSGRQTSRNIEVASPAVLRSVRSNALSAGRGCRMPRIDGAIAESPPALLPPQTLQQFPGLGQFWIELQCRFGVPLGGRTVPHSQTDAAESQMSACRIRVDLQQTL